MKNINKRIIINILSFIILGILLSNSNNVYANNISQNTSLSTTANTSANTSSNKTSTNSVSSEASSNNANLKTLGIRPNDFKGFNPETTTYKANVPEKVEEIEVYATAQSSKAIVDGTGKKTLISGENNIKVTVTAEDKTQKVYTIQVNRGGETSENEGEDINGLSELKINDLELSPEFKTDIYQYNVKYIGEDKELDIKTVPTIANYDVEIIGNKDLKEGENNITILVSTPNGDNVATYQIIVNKSLVDKEAIAKKEAEEKELIKKVAIAGGALLVFIIIIVIIIKHKKKKRLEEDYYEDDGYEDDEYEEDEEDDEDYEYEEDEEIELPKSLRKKSRNIDKIEQNLGKRTKQEIKEEYLNKYKANKKMEFYDDEEDEKIIKRKSKGKRYK